MIPTADRQKATVKVRISFTDAMHRKLIDPAAETKILPDMGVKVTFLEEEKPGEAKGKIRGCGARAAKSAIRQDGASKYVFVVKNDTLERRAVTVGANRGTDVEITGGLQPEIRSGGKRPRIPCVMGKQSRSNNRSFDHG